MVVEWSRKVGSPMGWPVGHPKGWPESTKWCVCRAPNGVSVLPLLVEVWHLMCCLQAYLDLVERLNKNEELLKQTSENVMRESLLKTQQLASNEEALRMANEKIKQLEGKIATGGKRKRYGSDV